MLKPVAIVLTLALSLSFNLFFDHPAFAEGTNAVVDLPGCTTSTLARNDDGSTGLVDLGFSLNFFGTSYNALYVNNNGNVTFDSALSTYTPFGLSSTNRVIIAPFFADVDTRNTASGEVQYGSATFEGKPAFCVNWINVGYYNSKADKLNSFQLLLIDRSDVGAGNFDIIFNYDKVQWETGDASGGSGGLGGSSAHIGYSNGTGSEGTSFELYGSGIHGAFLDSNATTGLIHGNRNASQLGRYRFAIRNGNPKFISRDPAELFGHRRSSGYAADPVNTATGNFTDTTSELGFPSHVHGLDWVRTYNSLDAIQGLLGPGWATSFGSRVSEQSNGDVSLGDWDGRRVIFRRNPVACELPGPDEGGYSCDATSFAWHDMSGATEATLSDDSVSAAIDLPFPFSWYGGTKSLAYIGSNGLLCFDATECTSFRPLAPPDTTSPNDLVACFWEDLNPSAGGTITYKSAGQIFVVEFSQVPHYGSASTNSFQVQLTEGGEARCMFSSVISDGDGTPTAVGTENATGEAGVRYRYAEFSASEKGVRFSTAPAPAGSYQRPEEFFGDLLKNPDGTFKISYDNGATEEYDSAGRLSRRTNWDGQVVTLSYGDGKLLSASSTTGYSLSFTYLGDRISAVTSSDGRVVTYTYDTNGILASATAPDEGITNYQTDASGRIIEITDPDGKLIIANTYDSEGRVSQQSTPPGDVILFSYDDATGVTTVTHQERSASVQYAHDRDGRLTSLTDPHGAILSKSYDASGNLTSIVDRRSAAVSQTFDGHSNLTARTSPGGVSESFSYDFLDRLTSLTDGTGAITSFSYEGTERLPSSVTEPTGLITTYTVVGGLVTSVTDPDGVILAFGYDANRNLVSITDAEAQIISYSYDSAGLLTSETLPSGRGTSYTYDSGGRVTSVTNPAGGLVSYSYTAGGRLSAVTDETGTTTSYSYDSAGRLASTTDPLGNVTTYTYDADGNLTKVTRPGGAEWTATHDSLGRLLTETDATGVTTTYGYDADGNLTTKTEANGAATTSTFDLRGRLTSVEDPLDRTTAYGYDAIDRLVSVTDPLGDVTAFGYDSAGRLTQETDQAGGVTARSYTAAGRLHQLTDPNGNVTTHGYDALGRLITSTDVFGGVTAFSYDVDGRLVSETSPAGLVTTYSYDLAGRLSSVTDPAGGVTPRTYNARGELASETDPTGGVKAFVYDAAGRLVQATDPNGGMTAFEYDARGNRTKRTDAKGGIETFSYDLADRLTSKTDQLGSTTTYSYDALGRLAIVSDPSGVSETLSYDDAHRLTARTFAGGTSVSYVYDAAGRRTQMTDPTGTTTYTWDAVGRMTGVSYPSGKALSFSYDPLGNRTGLTYPDGTVASFSYDANSRLSGLTHPAAGSVSYSYDADGRLTSESLPGGASRSYGYASGRLSSFTESLGGSTTSTTLARDAAGRITSMTTGGTTTAFGYDPAGQLTASTAAGQTTSYSYDQVGNRTQKTKASEAVAYLYDAAHQISSATKQVLGIPTDSVSFAHDPAGRLTSATSATSSLQISYDARGLPATLTTNDAVRGTFTTSRSHDGDGRLTGINSITPLGTVRQHTLTWDPAEVPEVAVLTTGGADTKFLYGMGRAMALSTAGPAVFSRDALGSALRTADTKDYVRATSYDEFGIPEDALPGSLLEEVLAITGDESKDHTPLLGYRGEMHLDGLLHLRAREYAAGLGRFTAKDPLDGVAGDVVAANPYPYAANSPLNFVDPLGLRPIQDGDLRVLGSVIDRPQTAFDRFITQLRIHARIYEENDEFVRSAAARLAGFDAGLFGFLPPHRSEEIPYEILGSSGWRRELIDEDDSPARHFIGFLAEGYFHPNKAYGWLNLNEANGRGGASWQDIRSGRIAISIGIDLRRGRIDRWEAIERIIREAGDPSYLGGPQEAETDTPRPWLCYVPFVPC